MTIRFLKLSILTILVMTWLVFGQEKADEVVRVQTELVSVPVIVSDRNGRYIPGLGKKDFSVFQDSIEQKIEFFASTEEPINVALLIDTSQSTRLVLEDIKDSAVALIKQLKPQDKAMIVSFDSDVNVLSELTSDHKMLSRAVNNADIPDRRIGTKLRDAIADVVEIKFKDIHGRKAIIVMTDGKDAGSYERESDLFYRLEESDTLVYTIMFQTEERFRSRMMGRGGRVGGVFGRRFPDGGQFPPMGRRRDAGRREERVERMNRYAEEFLRDISDMTAGRFYSSKDGKLKQVFTSIVEELRFQYRIGYYPPEELSQAAIHQIKVKVARMDVVVRARSSYRSPNK